MAALPMWWGRRTLSSPHHLLHLLHLLLFHLSLARGSVNEGPLEFEDIMPDNPRDYDKMAPPKGGDDPTTVLVHVTVMSLDSIDESSMTYAADIFFAQSWKDWRLRLPDNMTHEYRLLPVAWLKDIWRPDSFFKNAKAVTFQEMTIPNHYLWLYQDNTILYMVKLTLVLSCAMNFQLYPHDTQECHMKIESLSHTTDDLVFIWEPEVPLVVDRNIELPQLDLVKKFTGDCTQVYSTGNFTCLEIVFTFKRRLGYYLFHTYIPTCLIVIMSWISFWIRPEAVPARVTLGVTSLLTLSTQHANSQKSLPPVSYIKAIDVFMSSCTVFVFFSLMEYALVNVVLGDVPEEPDPMRRVRPRTVLHVTPHQDTKMGECPGPEESPVLGGGKEGGGALPPPLHPKRRAASSPALHRRSNGRKPGCQTEFDSINTIASPSSAAPANGMSPLEMLGQGSCPAHLPSPQHLINGPMFSGVQHSALPHSTLQHTVNFGLPPPPPPPPLGPVKKQNHRRRRERAILIDRVSRILFPTSFTVLNVIYWSVFVIEWF
ncbi:glycine receptor subunit alpha-4-like [Eriocheir sinensis]|uniref:glycine receptor subunit alpha-4-like n=1 Tax=Eriocheir sinensis TaxID=95602 RepID=UPI0021C67EEE|nr:glycine receptor subunit alpha-4-like [Eriocheir sinensis]